MRLNKTKPHVNIRRRGISFIEVVCCIMVVAIMCSMVLGSAAIIQSYSKDTMAYTTMKMYAVNKIETIQSQLDSGIQIDGENYNDRGGDSGIHAYVTVSDIGEVFGKNTYHVQINMIYIESMLEIEVETILREGCTAIVP